MCPTNNFLCKSLRFVCETLSIMWGETVFRFFPLPFIVAFKNTCTCCCRSLAFLPRRFLPLLSSIHLKMFMLFSKTSTRCCCSMAGAFPIISVKMKCERERAHRKILNHMKWEWAGIVSESKGKNERARVEKRFFRGDRKCTDGSCYFCVEWDLNIVGKFTI